jgi:hypothetical protein
LKQLGTKSSNLSKAQNSPTPIQATQYKKLKFCPKLKTQKSSPRLLKKHLNNKKKLKFVKNSKLKTPPPRPLTKHLNTKSSNFVKTSKILPTSTEEST